MLALAWIQLAAALASALAAWFLLKSRSKPAQDLDARELTPLRIREFFQRTRKEIRAYCALLEETRDHAEKALAALDAELAGQVPPPAQAAARRAALAESLRPVQAELKRIRHQCDYPDLFLVKFPRLEPEAVAKLEARHESLRGQLSLPPSAEAGRLSASIRANYQYGLDQNTLFSDQVFSRPAGPAENQATWDRPESEQ